MRACSWCDSEEECYNDCNCSKCLDPNGYNRWRNANRQEYIKWLLRQADTKEEKIRFTAELNAIKKFESLNSK